MAPSDAAFLPNGLTVVALGEAGVRLSRTIAAGSWRSSTSRRTAW